LTKDGQILDVAMRAVYHSESEGGEDRELIIFERYYAGKENSSNQ